MGGSVKGGTVLGQYLSEFEKGDAANIILSRGRVVPTTPFDAIWKGVAEWFGVPPTGPDMDKVLPIHNNFPSDMLFGKADLFDALLGSEGESSTA